MTDAAFPGHFYTFLGQMLPEILTHLFKLSPALYGRHLSSGFGLVPCKLLFPKKESSFFFGIFLCDCQIASKRQTHGIH